MIEEIDTIKKFNLFWEQWFKREHFDFWISNSHFGLGEYNPQKTSTFVRNVFTSSLNNPHSLPNVKLWAYKYNGQYISGAMFLGEVNPLTGKRILSELFWMSNGKKAKTFIEKMSLIKLLRHVEKYGRDNSFDYIRMGKVIEVHPKTLDNFYAKSGYRADSMVYSKKLK